MRGGVVVGVTLEAVVAWLQLDLVIELSASVDVAVLAPASHKILPRDVAYVVALVVAKAPVAERIVDASGGVLHCCFPYWDRYWWQL
jgi:hypothetical protein